MWTPFECSIVDDVLNIIDWIHGHNATFRRILEHLTTMFINRFSIKCDRSQTENVLFQISLHHRARHVQQRLCAWNSLFLGLCFIEDNHWIYKTYWLDTYARPCRKRTNSFSFALFLTLNPFTILRAANFSPFDIIVSIVLNVEQHVLQLNPPHSVRGGFGKDLNFSGFLFKIKTYTFE